MPLITIPLAYLGWHYTLAIIDLVTIGRNLVAFIYHFFSLPVLLKTFFAPWRRLGESYKKGFYPEAWFETFILNTIMRIFGMILRLWLIVVGLVVLVLTIIAVVVVFVVWLLAPAIVVGGFITGLKLILA